MNSSDFVVVIHARISDRSADQAVMSKASEFTVLDRQCARLSAESKHVFLLYQSKKVHGKTRPSLATPSVSVFRTTRHRAIVLPVVADR